jgi:hypothetical protein
MAGNNSLPLWQFELQNHLQALIRGVETCLTQEALRAISAAQDGADTFSATIERFYRQLAPIAVQWCGPGSAGIAKYASDPAIAQAVRDYPRMHCEHSQCVLAQAFIGPAGGLVDRIRAAVASWIHPHGRVLNLIRQLLPDAQINLVPMAEVRVVRRSRRVVNRIAPGQYEVLELEETT